MKGIWQHKIVFAVRMCMDFQTWVDLPPVDGIRKNDEGGWFAYMKDVVIFGLLQEGISFVPIGNMWLCRDEDDRWYVLSQGDYDNLGEDRYVTLFPNKKTQRQVLAIMTIEKLKRDFAVLSPEEQKELYNKYPDMFINID